MRTELHILVIIPLVFHQIKDLKFEKRKLSRNDGDPVVFVGVLAVETVSLGDSNRINAWNFG